MTSIEQRLLAVEQENARLRKRLSRQNGAWIAGLLLLAGGSAIAGASLKNAVFDSVRAKEVVIVDGKGIIRARLGGDLPDAVMAGGHVAKRGSKAAGMIIYDEEGIERGGYVTQDEGSNAMITLDSKHRMAALMVAGPDASQNSALTLITKDGGIELRSDGNGSRLSVTDKSGLAYQQPAITALKPETCANYKGLELKYPGKRICQARFSDAACKACLED
ncbi:hypothetical protein ASD15_17115 [Massilia sp. Root351]|uniref:hypothetical protein n=1 Tax=Massilia sp. Root351 TaxID=1736522 RepID=UPI00070D37F2|nr:hypothetical protein [Massilia sp. Root351]KQV79756.1 hypothetical protein ASD15_17115 [Massilia sp. Root351]